MEFCVIGDFNIVCVKIFGCVKARIFKEFMLDCEVSTVTEELEKSGKYSFHNDALGLFITIDHCMLANVFVQDLLDVKFIDNDDNFSDHRSLALSTEFRNIERNEVQKLNFLHTLWNNEIKTIYYNRYGEELYKIQAPVCSMSYMYADQNHCKKIDKYCDAIVFALQVCSKRQDKCSSRIDNVKKVPWNAELCMLKQRVGMKRTV